jgi:hypothetical protein
MRLVLLALCVVVFSTAASAQRFEEPLQCRMFDRQIAHFEMMRARAVKIDSDLWKERFDNHLAKLEQHRLSQGCPDKSGAEKLARFIKDLMRLAAQGAITFFTMGMM